MPTEVSKKLEEAHKAAMLEDAMEVLREAREESRKHKRLPERKEMGVHIGDTISTPQRSSRLGAVAALIAAALTGGSLALVAATLLAPRGSTEIIKKVSSQSMEPSEYEVEIKLRDGKWELGNPKKIK